MKFSSQNLSASVTGMFKKNLSLAYWGMLLVLVILEILVIKNSVSIILASQAQPANVVTPKGVRVNFPDYDKVVNRFESANTFEPSLTTVQSPFRNKDAK